MFLTLAILFPQLLVPSPVHTAASTPAQVLLCYSEMVTHPLLHSCTSRIWRERHWDAEPGSGRICHSLGLDLHAKPALVEIWIMLPVHIARFPLWVYMYIIQVRCLKMESCLCPAGEIPPQHVLLLVPTGISLPALVGPGLRSGFLLGFNWSLGISWCTG